MESLLLALDVADPSMDDLNAIFRAAHSIKGGAGTFGFADMTAVTHVLETLLDKLRKQEMSLTTEMVDVFLQAGDAIAMQLAAHRGEGGVDQNQINVVCEKLEQLSSAHHAAALDVPKPEHRPIPLKPKKAENQKTKMCRQPHRIMKITDFLMTSLHRLQMTVTVSSMTLPRRQRQLCRHRMSKATVCLKIHPSPLSLL